MARSAQVLALEGLGVVQVRGLKNKRQYNGAIGLKLKEEEDHIEVWLCGGPYHGKTVSMKPQHACQRVILGPANVPEEQRVDRFCGVCLSDPEEDGRESQYWECCGKFVCNPCMREYFRGSSQPGAAPRNCVYCREPVPRDRYLRYDRCLDRLWTDGSADAAYMAIEWLPEDDVAYDAKTFALTQIAAGLGNRFSLYEHVTYVRFEDGWNSLRRVIQGELLSGDIGLTDEYLRYFGSRVLECDAILDHLLTKRKHLPPELRKDALNYRTYLRNKKAAFDSLCDGDRMWAPGRMALRLVDDDTTGDDIDEVIKSDILDRIQSILNVHVPYDATLDISFIGGELFRGAHNSAIIAAH